MSNDYLDEKVENEKLNFLPLSFELQVKSMHSSHSFLFSTPS